MSRFDAMQVCLRLALVSLAACGSVQPNPDGPPGDGAGRQPGDIIWARSMSAAFGQGIAEGAGGLVFTGSITAPADLGGGLLTPLGQADLVIGDFMASDASYVYHNRINRQGGGQVYGFLERTDNQGNPLVFGVSYGDVDLGEGPITGGGGSAGSSFADGFIGRYGPNAPAWVNRLVGPGEDKILTTAPAPGGELYVGGWFEQTTTWEGQSLTSAGGRDLFLAKMNSFTGQITLTKPLGGPGRDEVSSIAGDGTDLVVGGFFDDTLDFGGATTPITASPTTGAPTLDLFVARLDATTAGIWATHFGGSGEDRSTQVALDRAGDVYLAASFQNQIAFGAVNLTAKAMHDIVIAKLRGSDGTVLWAVSLGSDADDSAMHITTDAAGNPVVSGFLGSDAFITSFDTRTGAARWQHTIHTTGASYGWTLTTGVDGDLYAVVNLGGAFDFGVPLIGPPGPASVILRITP
jgi:hypothetical protein